MTARNHGGAAMAHGMGKLALGVLACAVIAACGSGGGARSDAPPLNSGGNPGTPTPPPTPPPTTPPPSTTPEPAIDAHLALTNATDAQRGGITGAGYAIGVVDTGVNRNHPALAGRVAANLVYVSSANDLRVDDKVGHGTTVAQLAAGRAVGRWPGGVAPGATILSARIIQDESPKDDGSGQGNEVTGALGLKSIHQDLAARGMRIMNNSWGGLYWTQLSATAPIADEYRFFIRDNDGLVVFATGNEGRANPTDMAALPSKAGPGDSRPAADLEQGWLAVAALDTATPTQLASYSNACGLARRYCLVAPGTSVFTGHDDTASSITYYYGSGTSYAAPLVSGAAALVWEKYPYFNNDLVRQTLLGTATDLGQPGPDEVFGYGLLNVEKALRGPGRFDWGDVDVTVAASSTGTTWSNDIAGDGGLIKRGRGELFLSGQNSYTGATRIEQGALTLRDGARLTSEVSIATVATPAEAATLRFHQGGATVRGNVSNGGVLAQYELADGARIEGNYLQTAQGTYDTALGASALKVTGTATLQGGRLNFSRVASGYVPAAGVVQPLIQADGGLSGTFDSYSFSSNFVLLNGAPVYDANSASFRVDQVTVAAAASAAGLDAAAVASASRVDTAFGVLDTPGTALPGFAGAAGELQRVQGNQALAASLDSLSGRAHSLAQALTFDNIDMQRRALSSHFDERLAQPWSAGAWSAGLGGSGQGSYVGSGFEVNGWMLGNDYRLGEHGLAGFAFGQTRASDGASAGLDRTRDRQSQGQVYGGWQRGHAYALAQLGFGRYDRAIDRQLLLGAAQYGVHTDYAGSFTTANLELGYRLGMGSVNLTSYLGAEHARVRSDGFSEQGGFGFGLRAGDGLSTRSQAVAGLRAEHAWRGLSLRGYAEWQQALSADGLSMQASFVGIDAWAPMSGLQPARSGGLLGLSLDAWLSPSSTLSFGYDQRFGQRGDTHMLSLRYGMGF